MKRDQLHQGFALIVDALHDGLDDIEADTVSLIELSQRIQALDRDDKDMLLLMVRHVVRLLDDTRVTLVMMQARHQSISEKVLMVQTLLQSGRPC